MHFVQISGVVFYAFVYFTDWLHTVHTLFIFESYIKYCKEDFKQMNFFIIARAPKGAWALLILQAFLLGYLEYLIVEFKHLRIQFTDHLGTVYQFKTDPVGSVSFKFVIDLML